MQLNTRIINIFYILSLRQLLEDLENKTCTETHCNEENVDEAVAKLAIIIPILVILVLAALVVLFIVCCCCCCNRNKKTFISNRPQTSLHPRLQPTLMAPSSSISSNQQTSSDHPLNGAYHTGEELIPPAAVYHPPETE